ncbi:MAG: hypothetical protein QG670_184 [Thermoproteota archaeon]|nr:hypothetical protein [Thermoproteota archaeon]
MDAKIEEIYGQVLQKVVPSSSKKEKILNLAEDVKKRVSSELDVVMSDVRVIVGGSVAKDTWLDDEADVDVFMLFPTSLNKEKLGEIGLRVAKNALRGFSQKERYAEHPYLEAEMDGIRVNVVPCYLIEQGKWLSAVDRSPFHTVYVRERLQAVDLRDEIRLLKKFMKGIGVYGAEVRVGGFSGYLCELLVLNYQSFHNTLEAASEWTLGMVIDIENLYHGRFDEARRYFDAVLTVVDPIDANRNVAAAVSYERLGEFIMACKIFLKKPSISFFYPEVEIPLSPSLFQKKLSTASFDLLFLLFDCNVTVPDVLWGQLYKSLRAIRKILVQNGFNVLEVSAWSDEKRRNILVYALESRLISASNLHLGPPIDSKEAVDFLAKHTGAESTVIGPWVEGNRWIVGLKRKYIDAASLLRDRLSNGGKDTGVGKILFEPLKNSLKILVNEEIIPFYSSDLDYALFMSSFIRGKPKWLI